MPEIKGLNDMQTRVDRHVFAEHLYGFDLNTGRVDRRINFEGNQGHEWYSLTKDEYPIFRGGIYQGFTARYDRRPYNCLYLMQYRDITARAMSKDEVIEMFPHLGDEE